MINLIIWSVCCWQLACQPLQPIFLPKILGVFWPDREIWKFCLWKLMNYGAHYLVTATLDSGQIGGGIFFFAIPQWGAAGKFFWLERCIYTVFAQFWGANLRELLYVTLSLDHMEGDFYCFNIIPRQGWLKWPQIRCTYSFASSGTRTYWGREYNICHFWTILRKLAKSGSYTFITPCFEYFAKLSNSFLLSIKCITFVKGIRKGVRFGPSIIFVQK